MASAKFAKQAIAGDGFRDSLKSDLRVWEGEGRGVEAIPHFRIEADPRVKDESGNFLAYMDSEGKPTIGIGSRTSSVYDENGKRISATPEQVEQDFDINVDEAIAGARRVIPTFDSLSVNRRRALSNMVFQMGATGVGGFEDMRAALAEVPPNFELAAKEILDSKFAREDTPRRARAMAKLMREG